jgi:hypothetical protein
MKRIRILTINLALGAVLSCTGAAQHAGAADVTVAVANFDGVGGWSYTETGNVDGNVFSGQHFVGAYTVNSNCSGTTSDSGGNSTALVIVNGGKEMMGIGTGSAVFSIVLKKISGSSD